ncbi:ATP-binding protein [Agarilytica rhodophyticola]|uniref:ATP-binding protein n=1 Tax=Agarilytica rhodophyticola TaxID=1737490 RepID=UPI000B344E35|nr:sensor histidine kinase [Agarilytica rhodophyticola]
MKPLRHMTLQLKMVIFIVALVLFQLGITALLSSRLVSSILEEQLGKRALDVAQTVASMPEIGALIEEQDPKGQLQTIAETIRLRTNAQFVVIGDSQARRYSHPNPKEIGRTMVGGDNNQALQNGLAYTSKAVGTLGPSLRGKVPVFSSDGSIVGIVSVGYLEENLRERIGDHRDIIIIANIVLVVIGIFFAILLAQNFKRAIFGLEPDEIGRMFKERSTILSSVREGIVAINQKGYITMINHAATKTLSLSANQHYLDSHIGDILPENGMIEVLHTGKSQLDLEHRVNNKDIIVNRIPIWDEHQVVGVVSSFREKDELDKLAGELSQVQEYAEMLRHQTHEYSNKLYTISGLIQLEAYDKAIELIGSETSGYQELLQFLVSAIPDPLLAGCILGKYNRAKELGVTLNVDRDSNFSDIPVWISKEKLVSILGNLLDNAYAAVTKITHTERVVNLSLTDLGNDLIFEVEDSGVGIDNSMVDRIYQKGISSSKLKGKGMGLFIVKEALTHMNGHITLNKSELGGALFTIYIPKK